MSPDARTAQSDENELSERDELHFAARMTNIQFTALAARLSRAPLVDELRALLEEKPRLRGKLASTEKVKVWLVNGWSTEALIHQNLAALTEDALRHSLHWAFPQAYYSVFSLLQAYHSASGLDIKRHDPLIRQFGLDLIAKKYPSVLRFYAIGSPPQVLGVRGGSPPSPLHFDSSCDTSIGIRISQFLNTTRKQNLIERKRNVQFKTKTGARKKRLGREEWARVSDSIGPTTILSCLYRKRIKANYRDIDSLLHEELDAVRLYNDLTKIVGTLNLVHEAFIASAMGIRLIEEACNSLPESVACVSGARMHTIKAIV